jgi:hypothetical protein
MDLLRSLNYRGNILSQYCNIPRPMSEDGVKEGNRMERMERGEGK